MNVSVEIGDYIRYNSPYGDRFGYVHKVSPDLIIKPDIRDHGPKYPFPDGITTLKILPMFVLEIVRPFQMVMDEQIKVLREI